MAKSSTGIGVWLYRQTGGRIMRLFGAPSEVLILTTRGRRSGKLRSVMLQGFRDGADLIVVASNVGRAANPGWYFNLKATPLAQVELMGSVMQVRAEELSAEEAAAFWSHLLRLFPAYGRYQRRIARVIPLIRLTRVEAPSMQAAARGETVEV
jgi:deazaflavin-dependent oxidoreductase (nitroreductase family)